MSDIVQPNPQLLRVCVFKRRFRFTISSCATEIDELLVNGAAVGSIAVESENADAVLSVVESVGLDVYEDVS